MCLEFSWFQEAESRKKIRDEEGVSISEAVDCLGMFHTTAYPIGGEMAVWIFNNWTLSQIYELPEGSRDTFFEIINGLQQDNAANEQPTDSLLVKKWVEWIVTAFNNLGGTAYLEQVYAEIERIKPDHLTSQWHATVRNVIESHSSDSRNYSKSRDDLFYSVDGIGNGHWGLRRLKI